MIVFVFIVRTIGDLLPVILFEDVVSYTHVWLSVHSITMRLLESSKTSSGTNGGMSSKLCLILAV